MARRFHDCHDCHGDPRNAGIGIGIGIGALGSAFGSGCGCCAGTWHGARSRPGVGPLPEPARMPPAHRPAHPADEGLT